MRNPKRQCKTVRALIDDCSQGTFSSEILVKDLHIQKRKIHATHEGVGATTFVTSHSAASFVVESLIDPQFRMTIDTLVYPEVSSYNPYPYLEERIDLLLGADVHGQIILGRLCKGPNKFLIAHETVFR